MEDKTVLAAEQVDVELASLQGWTREGIIIRRHFVLANFKDITAFLQHLVDTIATQNHHPDFSLDTGSRTVAVAVATHSEGGVTRSDIQFATTLNEWTPSG